MTWFTSLFAADAGTKIVETIGNVIDETFTSDEERERLKQRLPELQVELNKIEAGHRSVFVAGWRPFIGWVCGLGLGFTFLVNPVIQWYTGQAGPEIPTDVMMELVLAMLGLSGLRTYEKLKKVTK